ncbi:MAG: hypothetical protein ACJAU2_000373 [Maribacter sp.]|jgi:hypothetical protein
MMEARIQAVIIIITIFCDIPEMTASEKAVLSLHRIRPKPGARINTGQNPRSSGAPESAIVITPVTDSKNRKSTPKVPL